MTQKPPPNRRRSPLVLVVGLVFLFGPSLAFAFGERPAEIENRRLAAFPTLDSGWHFFGKLNTWANDHLPLRDRAIAANTRFSESVFGQTPQYGGSSTTTAIVAPPSTTTQKGVRQYPRVVPGRDGWLFFGGDFAGACQPKMDLEKTLARLDHFADLVRHSGRKFVFVIAPDKSTMNPGKLADHYLGDDCAPAAKARFWQRIAARPPVGYVDVKGPLGDLQGRTGENLWRPTDTHWAGHGAAVFVQQLVDAIQPGLWRPSELVATGPSLARGDLSALLGTPKQDTLPGYLLRRPGVTVTSATDRLAATTTGVPLVQGSTLILGDSFTQTSKPMLAPFFRQARILQPKSAEVSPGAVVNAVLGAKTVVLEIVERSVDGGDVPIVDQRFLDQLEVALRG